MALSKETLDFLVENRIQNSRSWFLEHRKEYQKYVKQPLLELAQQLAVCAAEIDPDIIAVPSRAISRINRDTRFTKDKALYRDVMWCAFSRDKKIYDTPCALVLEFSPMGFRYGCGYWQTPPKTLEAMRELILADSPLFRKAEKARSSSSLFALEGDCYKRSRFPEQPERLRYWLDRKNISYLHNSKDFSLLFSDRLSSVVAEGFRELQPVYAFFKEAENRAREKRDVL